MKIFRLFTLCAVLVSSLAAGAQELVKDAAAELTDGTVIALQSRAQNGGGQYFNGTDQKAAAFITNVLYIVEGNAATGLKLRRLTDGKYVGGTGANNAAVAMASDVASAVTFTAASVGHGGAYTSDGTIMTGTDEKLLVRFTVKGGDVALNAQGDNTKPKYFNGKGSFSVWYVYAYNIVTNAEAQLINGSVISLQCRDYNGGGSYYFNGAKAKTAEFSADNLFVVEGNAVAGMKLRRLNGTTYIGRDGNNTVEVDEANAVLFTAKSYKSSSGFQFDGSKNSELDGTVENLYVRFFVKGQETYLNTRNKGDAPTYAGGKGGYSAWYVRKYPNSSATVSQASLSFNRTGGTAETVSVSVSISGSGEGENGSEHTAAATFAMEDSHGLKTSNNVMPTVLCPNVNIGNGTNADKTNASAQWKFTLTGLPAGFSFSQALLEIHPLTVDNYQGSDQTRYSAVTLSCGEGDGKQTWPTFDNINISKGVDHRGEWWALAGESITADEEGNLVLTLDITKGSSHNGTGFFFGLSGIKLIGNKIADESEISEQTITDMMTADVAELLAGITSGYERLGYAFPVPADGVEAADVAWPQMPNSAFTGLDSNFDLLAHAKSAIENGENLTEAKENLAEFVRISNKNYPVSVVYKAAARFGTLYTPFAATLPEGLTRWECTTHDDTALTLTDGGSSLAANTAYIVEATDESASGTTAQLIGFYSLSNTQANSSSLLVGTHAGTTAPAGSYVLQNQNGVLGFYLVDAGTEIAVPAGKCYLQLPDGETGGAEAVKCLRFPDGTLTAIDAVDAAEPADAATYDLSGRRVGKAEKGLYIVGGRKVLVK